MKKLIKYEKQKSKVNENKTIELSSDSKYFLKEKNVILPKNHCTNDCCSKKKKDVFERLSRPNSKTKICSKAVSTVGIQTDLQYKHTSKLQIFFNIICYHIIHFLMKLYVDNNK